MKEITGVWPLSEWVEVKVRFKMPRFLFLFFMWVVLGCSWRSWRSARPSSTVLGIAVKWTKRRRRKRPVWKGSPAGRVRRASSCWETCKVYSPPSRKMTSVGTADLSSPHVCVCVGVFFLFCFLRGLHLLSFWLRPNQLDERRYHSGTF